MRRAAFEDEEVLVSHQMLRAGNPKFDRSAPRGDEEVAALECRAIDAHRVLSVNLA